MNKEIKLINPYSSIINFNKLCPNDLEKLYLKGSSPYRLYEKIHGQNVSFRINQNDIEVRSRTVIVGKYDRLNLSDCELITSSISHDIIRIINHFQEQFNKDESKELIIYGELFGGYYNKKQGARRIIQHGIQYDINHQYLIFDICIDGKFIDPDGIDYHIGEILELPTVPRLMYMGTFEEVLKFVEENLNSTESRVPQLYGNEKVENNFIEGFVLRLGNDPELKIKFISDKYNEVKKGKTFINKDKINLINDINKNFNIQLIIEKSINKLNIDLTKKEDKPRFKDLINMIFEEFNENLKFENETDINNLKSIAGRLFGEYYKNNIIIKENK